MVEADTDAGPGHVDHPLVEAGAVERRRYQLQLAETALSTHTLVCLPTGLGKTAVSLLVTGTRLDALGGKALLLAPTKPLVAQHADDYRRWLTIPDDEIVVFTGEVSPDERAEVWDEATVVVATPQVIENDLIGRRISLEDVVHCTFDECHRATGEYAYLYIADRYHADAADPLVTGLSASPGDDLEAIQAVCENLGIVEVEVMTEEDADVAQYAGTTDVEWRRVELPDEVLAIRDAINDVIRDRLSRLKELGVTDSTDPELPERDLRRLRGELQGLIDTGDPSGYEGMSIHAEVRKLKTAVAYVETQSVESLRRYFERQKNAARSSGASKASQRLVSDRRIRKAMRLADKYDDIHPKFRQARMLIAETLGIEDGDRVIVFTESRDTAEALTEFLGAHFETRRFVGQGDREGSDGMTQREQQETLDAFRGGEFSVLVSTSVAEEGLDVPDVDLVLFYEPVSTAIRSIQRKGRTGRGRAGRVVVLIAEGTRDEAFFWISRNREKQMRQELRYLKGAENEIETALSARQREDTEATATGEQDDRQHGLTDFLGAASGNGEGSDGEVEGDGDAEMTEGVVATPQGDGDEVEIVADQRELDAVIARDLSKRDGIRVRLETLAVGDYILSDRVAVERKSVSDFLDTLVGEDRSMFEQVRDTARHYARPVVVIEGEGSLYAERNVHPNAIRGALASLAVDFGASVLRTTDEADTADLLAVIARREQQKGGRDVRVHGSKSQRTLAEQQEYVVSSIAEVGPVTARALLEALGSVEAVLTASAEELQEVSGVGEVTAERIREVVSGEYNPSRR